VLRAGPLVTIQDRGRFGMLRHGIGESGPMDAGAFAESASGLPVAGTAAIEFTQAGVDFEVTGDVAAGFAGGDFILAINGVTQPWPTVARLDRGAKVTIKPGASGNYGYVRFDHEIGVPPILGSRSTNCTVGLGGFEGRALHAGDELPLVPVSEPIAEHRVHASGHEGPIRVTWGLHADLFPAVLRQRFVSEPFEISPRLDRMGVRLADPAGIFRETRILGLVSDAVVAGDIQVLGDGSPIVLMRDHQPTGGYPRIATILSADLDRFAQMRPGSTVTFQSISPGHAYAARVR